MNSFIACVFVVVSIHFSPVLPTDLKEEVQVELVREHLTSRSRRSVQETNLPDQLDIHLHAGEHLPLRLKRSSFPPVVTSNESVSSYIHDAAVYTDLSQGAAMIVKKKNGQYTLSGTLDRGGVGYELKPVVRNPRDAGEPDVVTHEWFQLGLNGTGLNFGHDAVVDPVDREEIIDILNINHHHTDFDRTKRSTLTSDMTGDMTPLRRHKRKAALHTVEIAVVADYSDYSAWERYVGSSAAISEMTLYYTYMAEAMRIRYESIDDPDLSVTTKVTELRILSDDTEGDILEYWADFFGEVDAVTGLLVFADWVENKTSIPLPVSDHYMLSTRFSIGYGVLGVAFLARTCTYMGVSISVDILEGLQGMVAAHEVGHSLSAIHDRDTDGICTDDAQFIMAAAVPLTVDLNNTGNPWRFSDCSIQSFKSFFVSHSCTLPENTGVDPNTLPSPPEGQEAGQVVSRDDQCRLTFSDSDSFFCEGTQASIEGGFESLCGSMYCYYPYYEECSPIMPLEFTPCNTTATGKWCVHGKCVEIEDSKPGSFTACLPSWYDADYRLFVDCVRSHVELNEAMTT